MGDGKISKFGSYKYDIYPLETSSVERNFRGECSIHLLDTLQLTVVAFEAGLGIS